VWSWAIDGYWTAVADELSMLEETGFFQMALVLLVHTSACTFWLVKTLTCTPEEVVEFQHSHGFAHDRPEALPLKDKYLLAGYYINTIFTTVGFGDVTAVNSEERVFSVRRGL